MRSYIYRFKHLLSSWGIAVTMSASFFQGQEKVLESSEEWRQVSNGILVSWNALPMKLANEEISFLIAGIRSIEEEIKRNIHPLPIYIRIDSLSFAETDYQPDALQYAVRSLVAEAYSLSVNPVTVSFDKQANRYNFQTN